MNRSEIVLAGLLASVCGLGVAACATPGADGEPVPRAHPDSAAETQVFLPEVTRNGHVSLEQTLRERRSIRAFRDEALTLDELAQLLWAAQGVSDEARGFRTAPSAGALYPLETYVVIGHVREIDAGIYRYDPENHWLDPVFSGDVRSDLARAALGQGFVAEAPATVVFTGVYARTAARYGDRAERYVHMEAGHAAQNLSLQAVALGLGTVPVGAFQDDRVARLLELGKDESPLYILPVGKPR